MGLEHVTEEIHVEAEAKAAELTDEANEEAAEIEEKARQKAEEIRDEMEKKIEEEKEQIRKKEVPNARRKARKIKLQAKQDSIDEVFDQFRQQIKEMDADQKQKLFESAIEAVSSEISIGRVVTSPEMEDQVASMVDGTVVSDEAVEGMKIEDEDGRVSFDYTIDTVCETIESRMRGTVAKTLF